MRVKGSFKGNNNVLKLTLFEHEDHHFSHDSQASVRSEKSASERFFFCMVLPFNNGILSAPLHQHSLLSSVEC